MCELITSTTGKTERALSEVERPNRTVRLTHYMGLYCRISPMGRLGSAPDNTP